MLVYLLEPCSVLQFKQASRFPPSGEILQFEAFWEISKSCLIDRSYLGATSDWASGEWWSKPIEIGANWSLVSVYEYVLRLLYAVFSFDFRIRGQTSLSSTGTPR